MCYRAPHWHHLANMIEPSVYGGDAALCQFTLTIWYYYCGPFKYNFLLRLLCCHLKLDLFVGVEQKLELILLQRWILLFLAVYACYCWYAGQICRLFWSFGWLLKHWLSYFNWNHFRRLQKGIFCLSSALDRPSNTVFFPSVCVSVNRFILRRLRSQFFTSFHEIVCVAQKCRRFDAYCLWDKLEVVFRF